MDLCKYFYARGSKWAAMERNIRIKKEKCSTRRMKVSDDEGYDNRCKESTSQDLGVNVVNHVRRTTQRGETYQGDDPRTKASVITDNQPINNGQGTKMKCERFAKAWPPGG